jgi:hypothetical protein
MEIAMKVTGDGFTNDDGVLGLTATAGKNAVGALNTSTDRAVFPGGNALFGVTTAVGGAGAFSANNSASRESVRTALTPMVSRASLMIPTPRRFSPPTTPRPRRPWAAGRPRGGGILGVTTVPGAAGVFGANNSAKGVGVQGNGPDAGISGFSDKGSGIRAQSNSGTALLAQGGHLAARFEGNVEVTGDITLVNQDLAEDFTIADHGHGEPGTVMALDGEGKLTPSWRSYDKRVVGVVTGAGDFKPALFLGRMEMEPNRLPIALVGKVFCKVDAQYASIDVGDLLTTSQTPGHAMKADEPNRAFGSVIGKALRPLPAGQGLIPILIALQ